MRWSIEHDLQVHAEPELVRLLAQVDLDAHMEDLNLKEIGAVLGVTELRVCQLHSQVVARLRKAWPTYR